MFCICISGDTKVAAVFDSCLHENWEWGWGFNTKAYIGIGMCPEKINKNLTLNYGSFGHRGRLLTVCFVCVCM